MKGYPKLFINGEWISGRGGKIVHNISPYTGRTLYEYYTASVEDINNAFCAAYDSFQVWSCTQPMQKQKLLEQLLHVAIKMKDDICACLIEEGGAVNLKADIEYQATINIIKEALNYPYMANGKILPSDNKGRDNYVVKRPRGVIVVIVPWNFPILLAMRSIIPAIAVGNTVILKPSSETPASGLIIAELFEQADAPKGLLNVIVGSGNDIGNEIITHPLASMISFTGSTPVGKHVGQLASKHLKHMSLELGGNNAMIVLDDANIEQAAKAAAFGAFFHQGQICMSINRIITTKNVHQKFVDAFIEEVKKLKVGNVTDTDAFIGPMISEAHRIKVENYIDATIKAGAKIVLRGKTEGNFIHPWIFDEASNTMPAAENEVFGPVCCVLTAADENEAINMANDTNYGLCASIFTGDRYHGLQIADRLAVGMVHINDQTVMDEPHVMFGGEKDSGFGRFNGQWIVNSMLTEKWISVQNTSNL